MASAAESIAGQQRNIVIIGGGVIGCTTAYFLTRHPKYDPALHKITLLEAHSIAAGASGKAGGLLGLWAYPQELVGLSYRLHRELADEHNGAQLWGYRTLNGCGSISAKVRRRDLDEAPAAKLQSAAKASPDVNDSTSAEGNSQQGSNGKEALPIHSQASELSPKKADGTAESSKDWEKLPKQDTHASSQFEASLLPSDLDWVSKNLVIAYSQMGPDGASETSQVHPFHFTTQIARLAQEKGVDIRLRCQVNAIMSDKAASTHRVEYLDRDAGAALALNNLTDVIVTAGPWTGTLLPRTQVQGLRAHSVVLEADVSPYAVFTNINLPNDWVPEHREKMGEKRKHRGNVDPEIYARPFGEVYACGEPDTTIPLPATADLVQTDAAQCDDIAAYVSTISPALAAAPVKTRQACYLPRHMRSGEERSPLIGRTNTQGLWVASGHTCWGIQNGPGTGRIMAEMVMDGEATSAKVDKFDPRKFKV